MKPNVGKRTNFDPMVRGRELSSKLALVALFGLEIVTPRQLHGAANPVAGQPGRDLTVDKNENLATGTLVPPEDLKDIDGLKNQARRLDWYLPGFTVLSLMFTVWLSVSAVNPGAMGGWISIGLCIAAGTMGSAVAALLSSQKRRANGWEVGSGKKYPEPTPKDKFNAGMVPQFYARPLLGSVVGAVFYLGAPSIFSLASANQEDLRNLAFWSFVVGVMAKTFLETLKDLFKKLGGGSTN